MPSFDFIETRYGRLANVFQHDLIVQSLRLYGEWAQSEIEVLGRLIRSGDVVLDVGAYIGTHTLAFSRMVGADGLVVSFEPQPVAAQALRAALEENSLRNVVFHEAAVSPEGVALRPGCVDQDNAGSFALVRADMESLDAFRTVSVDSLALPRCDLIKVDVEGLEADVLESASETIARTRPLLACECNFVEAGSRLLKWAAHHKYLVFGMAIPAFNADNYLGSTRDVFGRAKEVILILAPNNSHEKLKVIRNINNINEIEDLDDLSAIMFEKPQYLNELSALKKNFGADDRGNSASDISPSSGNPLKIIVPFYKSPELVGPLFDSLVRCAEEINRLDGKIVFYNDSPGHEGLRSALDECKYKNTNINLSIINNQSNLGFIKTINNAIIDSITNKEDIVIINSDTVVFRGFISELSAVAYSDPMIGFVSPRSNNATICNFPHGVDAQSLMPSEAHALFSRVAHRLPRATYVPTAVGFCLYVKWQILAEFGGFDSAYGQGYNEENDLIMRANRCGYRAALANWSFVWHAGEASFSKTSKSRVEREERNARILNARYPEYVSSIQSYMNSATFKAERMVGGSLQLHSPTRIGFDFSDFGSYCNGTFEAGIRLLEAAIDSWPPEIQMVVFMEEPAWYFHRLDRFARIMRRDVESDDGVDAVLRMGQPFSFVSIDRLMRRAPVVSCFMLDTISFDCAYLKRYFDEAVWHFTMKWCDVIFTNSAFTAQQFNRRFELGVNTVLMPSPHSFTPSDYLRHSRTEMQYAKLLFNSETYILVVGNKFEHKALEATIANLAAAAPELRLVALGLTTTSFSNVRPVPSGHLDEHDLEALYAGAACVVYPSHYEGFGFPLMHALARRKPVLVRRLPPFREAVAAMRDGGSNVIWFDTTAELCELVRAGVPEWRGGDAIGEAHGWRRSAGEVLSVLMDRLGSVQLTVVADRLRWLDMAAERGGLSVRRGRLEAVRDFLSYYPTLYRVAARAWPAVKRLRQAFLRPTRLPR